MSRLEPEVGDVFLNKHSRRKTIILCDRNYYQCLVENGGLVARYKSEFLKMKYLGKSKANINQLFEVDDERSK